MTLSQPENYPRFLIVESVDKQKLLSQSVFLVSKFVEGILARTCDAIEQRTGEVLVEDKAQQQATVLLTQTRIADLDIRVTSHRSINSPQGMLSEPDLTNKTKADLLEGLKDQGATDVKRITIRLGQCRNMMMIDSI